MLRKDAIYTGTRCSLCNSPMVRNKNVVWCVRINCRNFKPTFIGCEKYFEVKSNG